ncbi:spermidine synthase [Hymenobacter weizhouensis]|uniref:spermidine synthase n=1 Tax=Hymenobacter sp. YIM 151500-1 TaxID=2987689 RepID=UPI002226D2D0|nr:fused MFS/spermidine synthase [Hymenobacter sp. YIM 151500-1]UYZ62819.1 fused MFS/spermidine synthase [Hymenobacter sp. YIM 151500-1]
MHRLLTRLRHWLSYVVPLTRRVPSQHSGELEITLYQGQKVLNTRHANYSYGGLHQVLRYGLLFTQPPATAPVLVLGLGGGSVVQLLRQELHLHGPITAVELDPAVVSVAADEFGIEASDTLRVVCADAFAWLPTAPADTYGLVVIDLFLDLELPAGLAQASFWRQVHRCLQPGGWVLFNSLLRQDLLIDHVPASDKLPSLGLVVQEQLEVELNRLLVLRRQK